MYNPLITTAQISGDILTYRTLAKGNLRKFKNQYEETYEQALAEMIKGSDGML